MNAALRRTRTLGHPRGGFTLVELLVVIGIVGLLVTLSLVGLTRALGTAKTAATSAQLSALAQGLSMYEADFGDVPQLVTGLGDYSDGSNTFSDAIETPEVLASEPGQSAAARRTAIRDAYRNARYMSEWSLPIFLLGVGDINSDEDTVDYVGDAAVEDEDLAFDDGVAGFGMRHPGRVGAWKAVSGNDLVHRPQMEGKTYGPYVEPGALEKFLERVPVSYNSADSRIERDDASNQFLYRFVDTFGNPIRYYRGWPTRNPLDPEAPSSVGWIPIELRSYQSVQSQWDQDFEVSQGQVDPAADGLSKAKYALLAAGADPGEYTYDDGGTLVEVAPFGDVVPNADRTGVLRLQDGVGSLSALFDPLAQAGLDPADADSEVVFRTFMEMLETNVRYIP